MTAHLDPASYILDLDIDLPVVEVTLWERTTTVFRADVLEAADWFRASTDKRAGHRRIVEWPTAEDLDDTEDNWPTEPPVAKIVNELGRPVIQLEAMPA